MDAFIGEIRLFPYTYVPDGWLACDGSLHDLRQYQGLFAVIGIKFGGDGTSTFGVPDLRGLTVVGTGDDPVDTFDPVWAASGGVEQVQLTASMVPSHTHTLNAAVVTPLSRVASAGGNYIGALSTNTKVNNVFVNAPAFTSSTAGPTSAGYIAAGTISVFAGGSAAHENRQPYLAATYCIAYMGDFPIRPS